MNQPKNQQQVASLLRQKLQLWEGPERLGRRVRFSSGCAVVDALLPRGGFRLGMLAEWLATCRGSGAGLLGLMAAREACRHGGYLVVVERQRSFYPPVAAAWGIDLRRTLVVRAASRADQVWALIQALESPAAGAVWSPLETIDAHSFRRLQLAAQRGGTFGALIRPSTARGQPSWADVQLWVTPAAGHEPVRAEIQLARCHSSRAGSKTVIEIDEVTGVLRDAAKFTPLPVVATLAAPTTSARQARA